jgi:hypothetical protein
MIQFLWTVVFIYLKMLHNYKYVFLNGQQGAIFSPPWFIDSQDTTNFTKLHTNFAKFRNFFAKFCWNLEPPYMREGSSLLDTMCFVCPSLRSACVPLPFLLSNSSILALKRTSYLSNKISGRTSIIFHCIEQYAYVQYSNVYITYKKTTHSSLWIFKWFLKFLEMISIIGCYMLQSNEILFIKVPKSTKLTVMQT